MNAFERDRIADALRQSDGVQTKAAERQKVRYEREGRRKAQAGIKERSLEEVMG